MPPHTPAPLIAHRALPEAHARAVALALALLADAPREAQLVAPRALAPR